MSKALDDVLGAVGATPAQQDTSVEGELSPSQKFTSSIEGLNMDAIRPILDNLGNALVVSAAGSGKTTALSVKIVYDFTNGRMTSTDNGQVMQRVWLGTFLRTGADDLRDAVVKYEKTLGFALHKYITISTLNAEFYRVCKQLGYAGDVISEGENKSLFKYVLRKHMHVSDEDEDKMYTRSQMLRGQISFDPQLSSIIQEVKALRNAKGMLDFADMEEYLYQSAVVEKRPEVVSFLKNRFTRIYLDEFQDVSHIQYEILKVYAGELGRNVSSVQDEIVKGCIIAIGDDDQSIYSWRGADSSFIVDSFVPDYQANVYHLNINYRTPQTILDAVLPSIQLNQKRLSKEIKSSSPGGDLRVVVSRGYSDAIRELVSRVGGDTMLGHSVAVLVRNNSDGVSAASALIQDGFLVKLTDPGMTFKYGLGRRAYGMLKILEGSTTPDALSGAALLTSKRNARDLAKSISNLGFWELSDDYVHGMITPLAEMYPALKQQVTTNGWNLDMLRVLMNNILSYYVGNNNYRVASVLAGILHVMQKYDDYAKFNKGLSQLSDKMSAAVELDSRPQVIVSSIHEFKGKEADSVYVWDDTVHWFEEGYLEEERRVHYIACTRARKSETLMTIRGNASAFLKEMDLRNTLR